MTYRTLVSALVLSLAALGCSEEQAPRPSTVVVPLQVKRGLLVARGMGDIDGLRKTNSIEALRCNYKRGFRWFDVDLATTADGELMCFNAGSEKQAGLPRRISELPVAEVEGKKYAQRYPITRLTRLLDETDRLGDVVLVLDTEGWTERVERALSRTLVYGPHRSTRIVLQFHREKNLKKVLSLSRDLNAGVVLILDRNSVDDAEAEQLVKKASPIAVVTTRERFSPWLAQRMHALHTPVLVQVVNDHEQIVSLARAGADGFYTDSYLPFGALAAEPSLALDCGATQPSARELAPWTQRDLRHEADVSLSACAERKGKHVVLSGCGAGASLHTTPLPAPPGKAIHVELDAEAGAAAVQLGIELLERAGVAREIRPRETISLSPNERRTVKRQVALPQGSPGLEVTIALAGAEQHLTVRRLRVAHGGFGEEEQQAPSHLERDTQQDTDPDAGR